MTVVRDTPLDFLLPFLRLPALRVCAGMTTEDGATVYSEDLLARPLTILGAPVFACTDRGIPYVTLNGSTDALSVADAVWNSPPGGITMFCVHKPFDTATTAQTMLGKWQTGGNTAFKISKGTAIRTDVSGDGGAGIGVTNGVPVAAWQATFARYTPSVELAIWNSLTSAPLLTATSVPAALYNSAAPLDIGAIRGNTGIATNFYNGSIAVAGFCGAILDSAYILRLIAHCKRFGVG
jgi:hypothetical protein